MLLQLWGTVTGNTADQGPSHQLARGRYQRMHASPRIKSAAARPPGNARALATITKPLALGLRGVVLRPARP